MKKINFIVPIIVLFFASALAQEKKNDIPIEQSYAGYKYKVVVPDLDIPWAFTWLPDGSMLINEKEGTLLHYKDGKKITIKNVPKVYTQGQGGLLDIELHPDYKNNGWIYFTYSSTIGNENGGNTTLSRAKLSGDALTNFELLYKATPNTTSPYHFGSRIEFDNECLVYFSVGERYNREQNPQDINRDGGKIYRLNDDGSIPKDNPFINKSGAKKAIYSYGHRNPQGMAKHPKTGKIWIHEHGPRGGDEINIINKGANYGWPIITYGINYGGSKITNITKKQGMEQPVYYWTPSIAPSGMSFVTSPLFPELHNTLLVGSLKFQYLEALTFKDNKVIKRERLFDNLGRMRCVRQGPDGYIYLAIEDLGIVKVFPK